MRKERLKKENIIENQMKCCNSHEQAITLIALVVTIVVLLILAGVSISLVLGQNGLINNAKEAKNKTLEAEKTEGESLNTASDYIKQTVGVTASGITADDYGKVVTNYQDGSNVWEIFYADENNIYLITRNNVGDQTLENAIQEESKYNGTSDFDGSEEFKNKYPAVQAGWLNKIYTPAENGTGKINYSSNYKNMICTEYLLDSSVWNVTYKTEKADWVIGAPTLEMFVAVYNKKNVNSQVTIPELYGSGYKYNDALYEKGSIGSSDGIIGGKKQSTNIFNHGYFYWLACPSSGNEEYIRNIGYYHEQVNANIYTGTDGIRPVVCLKSDSILILNKNEDESYYTLK